VKINKGNKKDNINKDNKVNKVNKVSKANRKYKKLHKNSIIERYASYDLYLKYYKIIIIYFDDKY
jgi:hypothetical protein